MFDAEVVVRLVVGGLFVGGFLMFLKAPESRRQELPPAVRRSWLEPEDAQQ